MNETDLIEEKLSEREKNLVNELMSADLSREAVIKIVDVLQVKKCIVSAVLPKSPSAETFGHFLRRFWDFEKSPYVTEKKILGQSVHKRYVENMLARAENYWIPKFGKRALGDMTLEDIKKQQRHLALCEQRVGTRKKDSFGRRIYERKHLAAETVNQVVRVATCALKWAYHNGLTKNDCFSGVMYCHVVPEKRIIPTIKQASAIFAEDWKHENSCVANLVAMCTGLRIGEVRALQIRDIDRDWIHVRHNWARKDGLKCPKNGEERKIRIPVELYKILRGLIRKNPYGCEPSDFIFWGYTKEIPDSTRHWNKDLQNVLKRLGIPNAEKITFHCWRHFFTTNMADNVDERKLQLATGHKSLDMLEHYAAHESEETLNELGQVAERLFLPIIKKVA